jgi:hypothetical protein
LREGISNRLLRAYHLRKDKQGASQDAAAELNRSIHECIPTRGAALYPAIVVMSPQSLLIIFTNPPQIRVQYALLEDFVSTEIDGVPVFASVAPWNSMHDLLIDRETRSFAGIVYPVAVREQAAIAAICQSLPRQVVRYCISPASAAAMLRDIENPLTNHLNVVGDPNVSVRQFPQALRSHRQTLRGCLAGELGRDQLPSDLLSVAGNYFLEQAAEAYLDDWASGGVNVDRVEVVWVNKPVDPNLPSYFPSDLDIELAQYFAEDIWFYGESGVYAIGINHLDKTLADYDLQLPESLGETSHT